MDITEAKLAKATLEKEIMSMIIGFENKTGCDLKGVDLININTSNKWNGEFKDDLIDVKIIANI